MIAKLSIVTTIVQGGDTLRGFLQALADQQGGPPLEVIVPYDASIGDEIEALKAQFPEAVYVDLGVVTPAKPITSGAGQHELYDRRRAKGLAAATGDVIAILEDRAPPRLDWAATVARLHERPERVIGGAIDPQPAGLLNWSFYVCDFGKYGRPFESGPVQWVSDVNVTYKREALEATRHLWKERFREPIVHWALLEQGEALYLSSELVVEYGRPGLTLATLLPERFDWGRLFGHIRAMHMSAPKRFLMSLAGPLIPFRLVLRHTLSQAKKGNLARALSAAPLILVMSTAWTAGEVWGYVTKRA